MCLTRDGYEAACHHCTGILKREYAAYVAKMRDELKKLPKGSKKLWYLSKALMDGMQRRIGIPSLRSAGGEWVHDGKGKADLFADTFNNKYVLPEAIPNQFSHKVDFHPCFTQSGFLPIQVRHAAKILRTLCADSGTGPDKLPTKLLKRCHDVLALPVALKCRLLLLRVFGLSFGGFTGCCHCTTRKTGQIL